MFYKNTCAVCYSALTQDDACPRCDRAIEYRVPTVRNKVGASLVIEAARECVGLPFKHMARGGNAIDCIGLVWHVGTKTGLIDNLNLPDYFAGIQYATNPSDTGGEDFKTVLRELSMSFHRRRASKKRPSDLVLFNDERWVHLGIMTNDETFVHAYAGTILSCVEQPYTERWEERAAAAFKWPGVIYGE